MLLLVLRAIQRPSDSHGKFHKRHILGWRGSVTIGYQACRSNGGNGGGTPDGGNGGGTPDGGNGGGTPDGGNGGGGSGGDVFPDDLAVAEGHVDQLREVLRGRILTMGHPGADIDNGADLPGGREEIDLLGALDPVPLQLDLRQQFARRLFRLSSRISLILNIQTHDLWQTPFEQREPASPLRRHNAHHQWYSGRLPGKKD